MKLTVLADRERALNVMQHAYAHGKYASVGRHFYMSKYGRYLQVLPGNTLPSTESGFVQSKFGKALPENIRIDVYNSPHGVGYQIYYEENRSAHSIGYAPEAADRTYTIEFPKPAASATSTPAGQ